MKSWKCIQALSFFMMASLIFCLSACSNETRVESDGKINVLVTTSIVADVVSQVGEDYIQLDLLLPVGTDPHTFNPTPQDMAKITNADILFINGMGLETFLDTYLGSTIENVNIVEVSDGVKVLGGSGDDDHSGIDPHTWTDPSNVMVWVENIKDALSVIDPQNADNYDQNAASYQSKLEELDSWILTSVSQIPQENRKIVTDHESFAYFAQRFGFSQIGTVIPGTSTLAEPSAADMALLEDLIRAENVQAIFVDATVNPMLAGRISKDTGVDIKMIYSGSLTAAGGEASTYLDYMHYNVTTIVEALK